MSALLVHPGTQHAAHLARELERHGQLAAFWTGIAWTENSPAAAVARSLAWVPGLRGLGSRLLHGVKPEHLHTRPLLELQALCRLKRSGASQLVIHERNAAMQLAIPDVDIRASTCVIGFDTSSWILAQRCRRVDRPLYLDRTTPHPAARVRIMREFLRGYPAWGGPEQERPHEVRDAEDEEHSSAHRIVVASSFARDTLLQEGVEASRIRIIPYGVDWDRFRQTVNPRTTTRPFRFLFAGALTAQKGIPLLLDAWRTLAPQDAELWLAGSIGVRELALIPDLPGLRLLGQVPKSGLPELYAACDVLVLPSLFDGFGLVLLEALAAGLHVIATTHTGAADLPANPTLRQLVGAGSLAELTASMEHSLAKPPCRADVVAAAADLKTTYSWPAYGDRWAELLRSPI